MTRIQAGDYDAAAELYKQFVNRLIGLAHTRLGRRVRQKVDSEDVVQSGFRTFFRRSKQDRLELGGWDHLWNLLALITLRKCGHQVRYFSRDRRNVEREVAQAISGEEHDSWQGIARDPTPSEAMKLTETVEQVMSKLKDRERPILVMSLQGYTCSEISDKIGRSERTVYRVLEYVKKELIGLQAEQS
jgi:RNA polymerase sigma-70 factor, ECF subfamily